MNATEVLNLHTSIMNSYDDYINNGNKFIADTEEVKLYLIKNSMKQIATYEAPALVCLIKSIPENPGRSILGAADNAYRIASEAVKEINTFEEYKIEFRKAYDAALRLELYSHLLSKVAGIPISLDVNGDHRDPLAPRIVELTQLVEQVIHLEYKQFQNEAPNFTTQDLRELNKLAHQLNNYIQSFQLKCNETSSPNLALVHEAALNLEIKAGKLIRSYQIKYEHDESWTPFLKNLALNLGLIATGVGALVSLGLLIYKGVTGNHAFFDKPLLRRTPNEEMAPVDQLLFPDEFKRTSNSNRLFSSVESAMNDIYDVKAGLAKMAMDESY